jgi:hypothetical protein
MTSATSYTAWTRVECLIFSTPLAQHAAHASTSPSDVPSVGMPA